MLSARSFLVIVQVGLLAVIAATAPPAGSPSARAGAAPDRSIQTSASVRELATGEYLRELVFAPGCGAPRLWTVKQPRTRPLDRSNPCFRRAGIYGLVHAGRNVVWGTVESGTHTLWLATRSLTTGEFHARARRFAVVQAGAEAAPPLLGEGRGNFVPYAIGPTIYLAAQSADSNDPITGRVTELSVRPLWLSRSGTGYVAIHRADGPIVLVGDVQGDVRRTHDYPPGVVRAAKLYGARLVVLRDGALDWHDNSKSSTIRLPRARSYGDGFCGRSQCARAELRLEDLHRDLVVYVLRRQIHVLRLTDGKDVVVREPNQGRVEAQLEGNGLSYTAGRRVAFVPMWRVTELLAGRGR